MMNHFLNIIPVKIHSDQFWNKRDFSVVVVGPFFFFKVIVQYKIHTTICNFGNLQKKRFQVL